MERVRLVKRLVARSSGVRCVAFPESHLVTTSRRHACKGWGRGVDPAPRDAAQNFGHVEMKWEPKYNAALTGDGAFHFLFKGC